MRSKVIVYTAASLGISTLCAQESTAQGSKAAVIAQAIESSDAGASQSRIKLDHGETPEPTFDLKVHEEPEFSDIRLVGFSNLDIESGGDQLDSI